MSHGELRSAPPRTRRALCHRSFLNLRPITLRHSRPKHSLFIVTLDIPVANEEVSGECAKCDNAAQVEQDETRLLFRSQLAWIQAAGGCTADERFVQTRRDRKAPATTAAASLQPAAGDPSLTQPGNQLPSADLTNCCARLEECGRAETRQSLSHRIRAQCWERHDSHVIVAQDMRSVE